VSRSVADFLLESCDTIRPLRLMIVATSVAMAKPLTWERLSPESIYPTGVAAVEQLRSLLPPGVSMSQFALRWILMFDAVSCAIPGGKNAEQVADNCRASEIPALTPETMVAVQDIYDAHVRPLVHSRW
jgi:aryl-alcohol dehydrogenase-like predicted oxidoreductase